MHDQREVPVSSNTIPGAVFKNATLPRMSPASVHLLSHLCLLSFALNPQAWAQWAEALPFLS